jgi:hypothetical protein
LKLKIQGRILTILLKFALIALVFQPRAGAASSSSPIVDFTANPVADEYADSMYPVQQYGSRLVLYVGNSYDHVQNRSGPARIYIQFDLSMIPLHAHVVSAEMALYQMYAPAASETYEVHMVESAWNELTMNWTTQPSTNPLIISRVNAPTEKNVWLEWNVTSAVQAWVNGDTPNYGLMIRIQQERTGVANEASGFFSREYPKHDLTPKLHVLCQNQPPFTFLVSTHVAGLPPELSTRIVSDTNENITVPGGGVGHLLFESGNTHTISADEYVTAGNATRYYAVTNSIPVSGDEELTVTYEPQFLVTMKSDPPGLIDQEWSRWYDPGARIDTPTAREVAEEHTDMKLVLDGWYINDARQAGNPIVVVINGPATVTARYITLYNVTVSSPYGKTSGSGWHLAGSNIEISVTPTYLPTEGALGYLGIGITFDHWSGSFEDTSPTTTITVNGPVQVQAAWREDPSRLLAGVAVVIGLVIVLMLLRMRGRRSRSRESTSRRARKKLTPERR